MVVHHDFIESDDWQLLTAYVRKYVHLFQEGKKIARLSAASCFKGIKNADRDDAKVVICSPHPDDEVLSGLLPLRLQMESGASVTNLAITLGSNPVRKQERLKELAAACRFLGFKLALSQEPLGFDDVAQPSYVENQDKQQDMIDMLVGHFNRLQPDIVVFPHVEDGHPAHIGTSNLVQQALQCYTQENNRHIICAETEFWHPMVNANLLVFADVEHVACMIGSLMQHAGEVTRNPYHLYLPAWMMDNVRRGSELLQGYGATAQGADFAVFYRLSQMKSGKKNTIDQKFVLGPETKANLANICKKIGVCPSK